MMPFGLKRNRRLLRFITRTLLCLALTILIIPPLIYRISHTDNIDHNNNHRYNNNNNNLNPHLFNLYSHIRNYLVNHNLTFVCGLRKVPLLMVDRDQNQLRLVMETNCLYESVQVFWFPEGFEEWSGRTPRPAHLLVQQSSAPEGGNDEDTHYSYVVYNLTVELSGNYVFYVRGTRPSSNSLFSYFSRPATNQILYKQTLTSCLHGRRQVEISNSPLPETIIKPQGYTETTIDQGGSQQGHCYPFRIAALSDNQWGAVTFLKVLRTLKQFNPNYLVHVGNAVQSVQDLNNWQTDFFDVLENAEVAPSIPLIYVPGNHDDEATYSKRNNYLGRRTSPVSTQQGGEQQLEKPWKAVTVGNVRFIILNSNIKTDEQKEFIATELQSETRKKCCTFTIVLIHIPPFMEWWDEQAWKLGGEKSWASFISADFVPLFEAHGVDLVISGHQHNYQRGERNNVKYTIIGGAGGQLENHFVENQHLYDFTHNVHHFVVMDVYAYQLVWKAFDIDGQLIDSFTIRKSSIR